MNITLLIGLVIAFGGVLFGFVSEGGALANLLKLPAFMIVVGGTIGTAFISFPISNIKKIPSAFKAMMFQKKHDYPQLIEMMCEVANKARRDGLLSLESEADKIKDPFIKKGLGYIADGADPEFLKQLLNNEIEANFKKVEDAAKVLEGMGGTSPTMGVLGTVMGMTTVLGHMGSDTSHIGTEIAGAFIATMYGVGIGNLVWLPLGNQMKVTAMHEAEHQEIMMEGLLAIQSGEPSSRLKDRLYAKVGEVGKKGAKAEKGQPVGTEA
ncbi:MAG: MotA/TolQ/ExbB proton channel family protein [Ethanoligenens sp.]